MQANVLGELIGQSLGQGEYRLVARLGAGAMGAVYEAEQRSLERRVAIKVLWPRLTDEPGLVGRFNREARIAARLDHLHILPVYGFGQERGLLYLVMRLVRGGSLKERLRAEGPHRRGWSPREVLELARQALPALDYAHRQGVIHRDLKPDNILLEPSDDFASGYRVFLSDFGIATLAQADDVELGLTQTGQTLGTPPYMAPEQVLEQPVDGRADLYAFGVMLFELLVGQLPYRGQTPLGVAMQHVRAPVPLARDLNPEVPASVEEVLLRALAKDRAHRFSTGAALLDALTRAVEESTPATPPRSVPARRPPTVQAAPAASAPAPAASAPAPAPAPTRTPAPAPAPIATPSAPVRQPERPPTARPAATRRRPMWALAVAVLILGAVVALAVDLGTQGRPPDQQPTPTSVVVDQPPAASAVAAAPDPRAWVVPASELGAGWSTTRESTAGSTPRLGVYEVEYTAPASADVPPHTVGFSLFASTSVADADAGEQQLRQTAEASGVVFQAWPNLANVDGSLRGQRTLSDQPQRMSIVHLFRVNTTVVVVEVIGQATDEATLTAEAEHAAELQRDRLLALPGS